MSAINYEYEWQQLKARLSFALAECTTEFNSKRSTSEGLTRLNERVHTIASVKALMEQIENGGKE